MERAFAYLDQGDQYVFYPRNSSWFICMTSSGEKSRDMAA